jgi:hypothetical protein
MSATTESHQAKGGHFHAVRFYEDDDSLCRIVAEFLGEGFLAKEPAIVLATSAHRRLIVACLTERGLDVERLQAKGDLFLLDAEDTLSKFMTDDSVDEPLFEAVMHDVIERACGGRTGRTVRLYGEMVDVLWKRGQNVAAIKLEMLWNRLAGTHDFSLLCGYSMGHFYKNVSAVEDICQHHTHVVSAGGELEPVEGAA